MFKFILGMLTGAIIVASSPTVRVEVEKVINASAEEVKEMGLQKKAKKLLNQMSVDIRDNKEDSATTKEKVVETATVKEKEEWNPTFKESPKDR